MKQLQFYLGKMAEECTEVAQIALKTSQFGPGEVMPGQPLNNFERCHQELDDLLAMVDELNDKFGFGYTPNPERKAAKKAKVLAYLGYSIHLGFVEGETEVREHPMLESARHAAITRQEADQANQQLRADGERLDWLMRNVSGADLRRLGIEYSAGCSRADLDAARQRHESAADSGNLPSVASPEQTAPAQLPETLAGLATSPELLNLLNSAAHRKLTPAERFEQRVSWCWSMQKFASGAARSKDEVRQWLADFDARRHPPVNAEGAPLPRDNCEVCLGERGGVPGNENIIGGKVMCDYCSADRHASPVVGHKTAIQGEDAFNAEQAKSGGMPYGTYGGC